VYVYVYVYVYVRARVCNQNANESNDEGLDMSNSVRLYCILHEEIELTYVSKTLRITTPKLIIF